jgi:hypothetical protein
VAGTFESSFFRKTPKEAVFFYREEDVFRTLFSGGNNSRAFKRMEYELLKYGYSIKYVHIKEAETLLEDWLRARRSPNGLVFLKIKQNLYESIRAPLQKLVRFMDHRAPTVLFISSGRPLRDRIKKMNHILLGGNTFTELCRAVARYLHENRYRKLTLFYDQNRRGHTIIAYLKIRPEILRLQRDFVFQQVIKPREETASPKEFIEKHIAEDVEKKGTISKYEYTPPLALEKDMIITNDFRKTYRSCLDSQVWVFAHDEDAAAALDWAEKNGIEVPEELSIVGLDNNPLFYHRGISSFEEDWDTIGYLLAHSVIGDFPIKKTGKGLLRTPAIMFNRNTSI